MSDKFDEMREIDGEIYDVDGIVKIFPPDYYAVEYEMEQKQVRYDPQQMKVVTEWVTVTGYFPWISNDKDAAEKYATSDTIRSVFAEFPEAMILIGTRVVPLARIPF